jgi:hypothetical protein
MTSILKVDTIQDTAGNNIINESGDTITIGASGDTITIPSGATLSNLGTATGFNPSGTITIDNIQFPATQVASADANNLDDYEEGTWTPSFVNAPNSGSVTSLAGDYVKIGKVVHIFVEIAGSGMGISSFARLEGLPFTAIDRSGAGVYIGGGIASTTTHGWNRVLAGTNQWYISLHASTVNTYALSATYQVA